MAGRRPLPSAVHKAKGTRPEGAASKREPKPPAGVPICQEWLNEVARAEWVVVTKILKKMKVLTKADYAILGLYCDTYALWRKACEKCEEQGEALERRDRKGQLIIARNPWYAIRENNAKLLRLYLVELGLTPAARTRIAAQVGHEEEKSGKPNWGQRVIGIDSQQRA